MASSRKSISATPAPAPNPRPNLTVVPRTQRRVRTTPLTLWHLLSLDAPSVATVWTIAVSHAAGVHLPWTSAAAMFVAVWMLYAADRLLDARSLDSPHAFHPDHENLEARHRFHHHHRRAFLIAITIAACILTALLRSLDIRALRLYILLATLLAAYFVLIHARADSAHRLPKELAVGIFFPAAVFIPTVARAPSLRLELLPVALLLAAVCSLNCLFLYAWEHPGPRTRAHFTTRWATRRLVPLTIAAAAISLLSIAAQQPTHAAHNTTQLLICLAASALLLLVLHHLRHTIEPTRLRALADLVLLTPLLLLFHPNFLTP